MSAPSSLSDEEANNTFGGRHLRATKDKQKSSYKLLRVKEEEGVGSKQEACTIDFIREIRARATCYLLLAKVNKLSERNKR